MTLLVVGASRQVHTALWQMAREASDETTNINRR